MEYKFNEKNIFSDLQNITNELAGLFRNFGTENIEDLIPWNRQLQYLA